MMTKYFSQLLDQYIEQGFEGKRTINYYAELGTDMLVLGLTLLQYLQLMVIYYSTIIYCIRKEGTYWTNFDLLLLFNISGCMECHLD